MKNTKNKVYVQGVPKICALFERLKFDTESEKF